MNKQKWCCEKLDSICNAYLDCDHKSDKHTPFNCSYTLIYVELGTKGLVVHDGHDGEGSQGYLVPIDFCPFCGQKL